MRTARSARAAILLVVASAAVTVVLAAALYRWEQQVATAHQHQAFLRTAENRVDSLRRELAQNEEMIRAVASLFHSSAVVTREEFRTFTRPLLAHHPDIRSIEWAPRIPAVEREAFERLIREQQPGFRVWSEGEPEDPRRTLYPIRYIEPLPGNRAALGLDLASESLRRAAVEAARREGRPRVSAPLNLVQASGGGPGFLVVTPVYSADQGRFDGVVRGVIQVENLVRQAFSVLQPNGIETWLRDITGDGSPTPLHRMSTTEAAPRHSGPFVHRERLEVGGRQWQMTVAAAPGAFQPEGPRLAWALLVGGTLLTVLLALYLRDTQRHTRALQDSESLFRSLFDNMAQGVVYQDPAGRITDANRSAQSILGVDLRRMRRRDATDPRWQTVHEDGSPFPGEAHPGMQALQTGAPQTNVIMGFHNPHLDEQRWLLVNAFPEFEPESGRPLRVFSTFDDITALKAARDEVQRQRDWAQRYLDVAGVILLVLDRHGRVVLINRCGLEALGREREEVEGRDWFAQFVPADHRDQNRGVFDDLIAGRLEPPEGSYEGPVCAADGTWRWVAWANTVVRDAGGGIQQVLSSGNDVTERRQAEAGLLLRNRALEATVNGILITDARSPDNRITYVNPAFERITGYTADEVIGRNPSFLQGDDREQAAITKIGTAVQEHRPTAVLLRNYRKDGSLFWNELHIAPVQDEHGGVTHYVGVINDLTEHKRYEEQLEHQSTHDDLTGLPNRNLLSDRLAQAIAYGQRSEHWVGTLVIDLDRFKLINDSLGHDYGDQVLCQIAERLEALIAPGDTIARQGGDEFVVVLSELGNPHDAEAFGERALAAITRPVSLAGREVQVDASIGASLSPRDGIDPATLLRNADAAMYRAKETGRANFQFFTDELNQQATERLTLENDLRQALANDGLRLHYQPQVDAASGRVTGFEALARWPHPEGGHIPPDRFIPVAAESGLIGPLGEWVLRTACRQLRRWHDAGHHALTMAVNLSGRQLRDQDLPKLVSEVLEETGIPPSRLELELTESEVMEEPEAAAATLQEVKGLGVHLAIDDFGTGYSSLAHLKRFAFDRIKIDRAFVRDVISDPSDAAIVRTIIATAEALHLTTIAEGVENEAQLRYLQRQGCNTLQGFHFAPGLTARKAEALLDQDRSLTPAAAPPQQPTVLVLDDEENILRALERLLRPEGYRILTADRPQEAFELLAREPVQVVISDQRMPEMDGVEFLSRIKEIYPDIVRIALSGYADLDTVTEAVNRGWIFRFITKPWDDQALFTHLREAFEEHRHLTGTAVASGQD